jgi:hypothetical protein
VLAKPILSAQLARFGRNNYAIRMLLWPFAFEWRAPLDLFAHTARDHEKRASRAALTQWDKCAAHLRRTSNFIACQFTTQHTHTNKYNCRHKERASEWRNQENVLACVLQINCNRP